MEVRPIDGNALIERLNGLYTALRKEGEQKYSPEINTVAFVLMDAASALSTLQAENERLKNKLSELAHFPFDEPGIGERTRLMAENAELRAELEQVKRENETLKHALQNWHEEV